MTRKPTFDPKAASDAAFKSIIGTGRQEFLAQGAGRSPRKGAKMRASISVSPDLYRAVQKIAHVDNVSVSELVTRFFEQYVGRNLSKLEEYEKK